MKKWKCVNMECKYSCELRTDVFPHKCVNWDRIPIWVEMEEPTTATLPKLTAEVFDREDCPADAKIAVVNHDGSVCFGSFATAEPFIGGWRGNGNGSWTQIPGKWDATDWKNSLIERPAKALPDWCKVGEWVAYYGENGHKYFKIAKIEFNRLYSEDGKFSLMCDVAQARLRPYTAEEMKALVGKVIEYDGGCYLVTMYDSKINDVLIGNGDLLSETTLKTYYTLDGSPCGKFEHLENGEWVE